MSKVAINAPKTPVTKGSNSVAAATVPNVCKMPGPPAPFVPTPLPNIGRSNISPKGYSKTVKINGHPVALEGATFGSQGDIASKGTGGGIVSSAAHGITRFVGPGSMNVKIEGKRVQLLGDPMLNNCGPNGNPPNAATMMGVVHKPSSSSKVSSPCAHPRTKCVPARDDAKKKPKNQVKQLESRARKAKKRKAKLEQKMENVARSPVKVAQVKKELLGLEKNILGYDFELKVAHDELEKGRLIETSVRIVCKDCGKEVTDLDVITRDDEGNTVIKECKAGGNFDKVQALTKQLPNIEKHYPGAKLHLTGPAEKIRNANVTKGWPTKPDKQLH